MRGVGVGRTQGRPSEPGSTVTTTTSGVAVPTPKVVVDIGGPTRLTSVPRPEVSVGVPSHCYTSSPAPARPGRRRARDTEHDGPDLGAPEHEGRGVGDEDWAVPGSGDKGDNTCPRDSTLAFPFFI